MVTDFTPGQARLGDGSTVVADLLVIATGASTSLARLAPELADLTPIKGHILEFEGVKVGPEVVRFAGGYLCPTPTGCLVGATMEPGRSDTTLDPGQVAALRSRAALYAPVLADAPMIARAGVRAATPDGLPLVGRSRAPGVWLAVGARRNGWLLAPQVARSLTRAILDADGGS